MEKRCCKCKEYKIHHNFHRDSSRIDGFGIYCKECKSIKDKEYSPKRRKYPEGYYYNRKIYEDYNQRRRNLHRLDPRIRLRGGAKGRAKKQGIYFNLKSYKDLPKVPKLCPVFNEPLIVGSGVATDFSPSLDRIDNNRGYIKRNIQIISRKANQMKSNATLEDIEKLYNYMKKIMKPTKEKK